MNIENKHIVFFAGIGGIGMSALARWFVREGKRVAGYDRVETSLTKSLSSEGMDIHYQDDVKLIPDWVTSNKEEVLVIYTPAIPADHKELNYFNSQGYDVIKRSRALGMISSQYRTVAVAGTHGKTTTSSMIAHILKYAQVNMVGFMGGVLQGYQSNLLVHGTPGKDTIVVAEADEYDRSFLQLSPTWAVVTSTDPDHLDIYGDHNSVKKSFEDFIAKIGIEGNLFINKKASNEISQPRGINSTAYSIGTHARAVKAQGHAFTFSFVNDDLVIENITLNIPGYHNVENAIAAILVCLNLNVPAEVIREALGAFNGVKRRFEFLHKSAGCIYIDDYAHHPEELKAAISSAKSLYPDKKICVVFQPHLFTRTRDFADGFAESLSLSDTVLLMEIYPAREEPIPGVTSDLIYNAIRPEVVKEKVNHANAVQKAMQSGCEVIMTLGAGNIDLITNELKEALDHKYEGEVIK